MTLIAPAQEGDACQATTARERLACRDARNRRRVREPIEKRQVKLAQIREQVQDGVLVIRQMTEEQRRRVAPPTMPPNRPETRFDA
jgi:hypothetical protein